MRLYEETFEVPISVGHHGLREHLRAEVERRLGPNVVPVRFVVTATRAEAYHCEVGVLCGPSEDLASIFELRKRPVMGSDRFNVALLVPTGIGAEVGGHAGDAGPVAKLLAQTCDALITHPNVVNASDINELPENGLYVEGSVISRLLMGTVGLQAPTLNRVLVVVDAHEDELFSNAAINAVNGARAAYGLLCPKVVRLKPPAKLFARFAPSGRAAGWIEGFDHVMSALHAYRSEYDAVAFSSVIDVPADYHVEYFDRGGAMINPWGGVEAIFTHAVSSLLDVPSAHSPMFESRGIANVDPGVVDSRMAAEAISLTFLQCILKGLHRSPRLVTDPSAFGRSGVISASDVSCLVIPDGCLGLPTLAALEQGIPVIAVRENRNLMRNDLSALPWAAGQYVMVQNYWEAAGVIAAMRAGIAPESVRRPMVEAPVVLRTLGGPEVGQFTDPTGTGSSLGEVSDRRGG